MAAEPQETEGLLLPAGSIFSERLELRLVGYRDLVALLAVHSVPEVNRYLPFETWQSMEDAELWYEKAVQRHKDREAIQWVICERGGNVLYGSCLLFGYEEEHQRAELGYGIGKEYWGQGLAKEAVTRTINYAFDELGLRRLDARVDPRNTSSCGLLLNLGFTLEGCLRERQYLKGELVDVNLFGLLRSEWCPS